MTPFKIDKEFVDAFGKYANSTQAPHIGFDLYGIYALLVFIDLEELSQLVGNSVKYQCLELIFSNQVPQTP